MAEGLPVMADINGRIDTRHGTPPLGTESRTVVRVGPHFTRGAARDDAALMVGLTSRDPGWGVTDGIPWVFTAFTIP
jgi:hypothetical protein